MISAQIISVSTQLAPNRVSIEDVERRILQSSPGLALPTGTIKRFTGVEYIYQREDNQNASDLGYYAAKTALSRASLKIEDIDLLIFASASQDLIEPATSNIVAAMLGAKGLPVFDVKNACNSFLNGVQIANSLIRSGDYNRVLIVSGETPSMAVRWELKEKQQFRDSFAGYSMSDGGAAIILQKTNTPQSGVIDIQLTSMSEHWSIGILGAGGSRSPRDLDSTYFKMNGTLLANAFADTGAGILEKTLADNKRSWDDFKAIGIHQVSAPYLDKICFLLDLPYDKIVDIVTKFGNVTSLSFPLQLESAINEGRVVSGDEFAFIGLAGGISVGLGIFRV